MVNSETRDYLLTTSICQGRKRRSMDLWFALVRAVEIAKMRRIKGNGGILSAYWVNNSYPGNVLGRMRRGEALNSAGKAGGTAI